MGQPFLPVKIASHKYECLEWRTYVSLGDLAALESFASPKSWIKLARLAFQIYSLVFHTCLYRAPIPLS